MNYKIPKWLFYILSWTWGLPMTLIGAVVMIVLMVFGYKPKKHNYCYYIEIGKSWGGCELGMFFLRDTTSSKSINNHEHGHGIQNCYFGVLMPFIVCIPSAIRYWYREIIYRTNKSKYNKLPDYDAIWFEGQATKLGTDLNMWLKSK